MPLKCWLNCQTVLQQGCFKTYFNRKWVCINYFVMSLKSSSLFEEIANLNIKIYIYVFSEKSLMAICTFFCDLSVNICPISYFTISFPINQYDKCHLLNIMRTLPIFIIIRNTQLLIRGFWFIPRNISAFISLFNIIFFHLITLFFIYNKHSISFIIIQIPVFVFHNFFYFFTW